jgi:hypothetical protein
MPVLGGIFLLKTHATLLSLLIQGEENLSKLESPDLFFENYLCAIFYHLILICLVTCG